MRPALAIVLCLAAAGVANFAVPHMHELVHGLEAFTAALGVWLVASLAARLERRESELKELGERAAKAERIASLTTLAAGAAHELATPLGTIAMVAKELERAAERRLDEASLEDARLIRAEVERCRAVLDQMSTEAGEVAGEHLSSVPARAFADEVLSRLPRGAADRLHVVVEPGAEELLLPRRGAAQVVAGLIKNGLDASRPDEKVDLCLAKQGSTAQILVVDRGAGMPPEVLARAEEPFFSTKGEGRGMGLGLFLARSFADRLGGSLTLESAEGRGTRVLLELPAPLPASRRAGEKVAEKVAA